MLGWVYGIQSFQLIKIGVAHNIRVRLHAMKLHNPHPLKVVLRRRSENPYLIERLMHRILAPRALGREWFDISPEQAREAANLAIAEGEVLRVEQVQWEMESAQRAEMRRGAGTGKHSETLNSSI